MAKPIEQRDIYLLQWLLSLSDILGLKRGQRIIWEASASLCCKVEMRQKRHSFNNAWLHEHDDPKSDKYTNVFKSTCMAICFAVYLLILTSECLITAFDS